MTTAHNLTNEKITTSRLKWTFVKILLTIAIFSLGVVVIVLALKPLIEGFYELKSFVNLLLVFIDVYYMFGFHAVRKNSEFYFWLLSYLVFDCVALVFIFYEDILF